MPGFSGHLTVGATHAIREGEELKEPILQVISIKKVPSTNPAQTERHRLYLLVLFVHGINGGVGF